MKTERVQDQKDKMLAELQLLWREQCDHLRKKKEQFATEVSCSPQDWVEIWVRTRIGNKLSFK